MNDQNTLLDISNLEVSYDTEDGIVRAVNDVSLRLVRGKTVGIVGETGAGKTTTAKAILRLLPERTGNIRSGKILFNGINLLELNEKEMQQIRGEKISMIFQDPMSSLNPVIRVGDQIAEVLELHERMQSGNVLSRILKKKNGARKKNSAEIEERVCRILEMVGIPKERRNDYPHQFSGGMKQRVVIAMALVCQPELVIADEPTTALDVTIQAQVLEMMDGLKRELNTSMILITHDLGIVAETCDTVAVIYAGEIIESGTVEDIFDPALPHHPYTVGLFGSIPRLNDTAPRLKPIAGLMPDPTDLPKGCKFHPRCEACMDRCQIDNPAGHTDGTHMIRCHLMEGRGTGNV